MTLRPHRRQFVIARGAVAPDETWAATPLADGWVLSHQADLALELDARDPARPRAVLGHRLRATSGRGAGRFVRLDWPCVTTDPAALLGVFHGRVGDAVALGSSPGLVMLALTGEVPPFDVADPLDHRGAINFVPAPGSRWRPVRRLHCDQAFDLAAGAVAHAGHGIRPLGGFSVAVETAAEELVGFARELAARTPGRIVLPLTAGLDSRTVAAAFLAAGIRFETTTQRYTGKASTDVRIAAAISRRFGLRHQIVTLAAPPDPDAGALLATHVSGAFLDWEITHLFPGRAYRYLGEGDAMIVAGCFELGRQYYARQFGELDFAAASGAAIWERRSGAPGPPGLTGFLDAWRDWRGAHPDGLDWVNAFYLDQRLGAWRAEIEHGYDLLPMTSLHPANNAAVLSALVTPEPADQAAGRLQQALIARLAPALARFPLNPPTLVQRLRRLKRRLRARPPSRHEGSS